MGLSSSGPTMSLDGGFKSTTSAIGNRSSYGFSYRPNGYSRSGMSNVRMMATATEEVTVSGDTKIEMKEDHMDKGFASKLTIEDLAENDLKGKKVLMRVDFNVPMKDGVITDPKRITATIPSIKYLMDNGAGVIILMSHMGRPNGEKNPKFTLEPVAAALKEHLGKEVTWVPDCAGDVAKKAVDEAKDGDVLLLENLRYYVAEEGKGEKDGEKVKATEDEIKSFRADLSSYGDLYVNDAFGTAHRAHSSMVGVDVDTRAAGLLMGKELKSFGKVLDNPERPLTVVMGGAKVTDKIKLIYNMLDIVDEMIIGGGMAYTFDKVLNGTDIGASLWDEEGAKTVPDIMKKAEEKGVKIHLPTDFVCSSKFGEDGEIKTTTRAEGVPEGWMGLDIGPESVKANSEVIKRSKTIFWNGPDRKSVV